MTDIEAMQAELDRRRNAERIEQIEAELSRRKIIAHLQTVYPDDWERRVQLLEDTVFHNEWIPDKYRAGLTLKQAEFLAYDGKECLFGGSGGGGKTVAALMGAAQYIHRPDYNALIIRRTYKQLEKAGSVMQVSKEWWHGKARWNGNEHKWYFPSGATIEFGYLDGPDDHLNFQGAVWAYVVFDELTQFGDQQQYTYLFTRMRRESGSDLPIRMRATANPGGPGHSQTYKRFIDPKTKKSAAHFIPAKLDDNPNLDREAYIEGMAEIDPITRAQILEGDWSAVKGGRFLREWFRYYRREEDQFTLYDAAGEEVERVNPHRCPRWMTCDPAAGITEESDHFVLSTWCLTPKANLVWLDCHRAKYEIPEQLGTVQRLYRRWNPQFVAVEEVLNQKALAQLLRRSLNPVMNVKSVSPLGKKKIERATASIVFVSSGRLYMPEDNRLFPLDDVEAELILFTGEDGQPDDICDTLFYSNFCLSMVSPFSTSPDNIKPTVREVFAPAGQDAARRAQQFGRKPSTGFFPPTTARPKNPW